jgi:uncharacterized protein YegP (UPF0339 family)
MEKEIKGYDVIFYRTIWSGLHLKKEWRWKIITDNGHNIGSSSEGYINKADCIYNAKSVGKSLTENNYIL